MSKLISPAATITVTGAFSSLIHSFLRVSFFSTLTLVNVAVSPALTSKEFAPFNV